MRVAHHTGTPPYLYLIMPQHRSIRTNSSLSYATNITVSHPFHTVKTPLFLHCVPTNAMALALRFAEEAEFRYYVNCRCSYIAYASCRFSSLFLCSSRACDSAPLEAPDVTFKAFFRVRPTRVGTDLLGYMT